MLNIFKKFVKKLLHFNNAVKINALGNETQLHCRVEKRNINSIIKIDHINNFKCRVPLKLIIQRSI